MHSWRIDSPTSFSLVAEDGTVHGRVRKGTRSKGWHPAWRGTGRKGEDHWIEGTRCYSPSTAREEVVRRLGLRASLVNPARA